jgi:ribosome-associated protein
LCSGESERQVRAIADHIDGVLSGQRQPPLSIEGISTSQWILMDFGDVVAHIFRSDIRHHYGLEKLWGDARRVRLPETKGLPAAALAPIRKRRSRQARQG